MLQSRLHILITGDSSDATRALDDAGRATEGAGSRMGAAAAGAGRAVALAGTAAVGLGGLVAGIGLQQAASAEQAEIAFTTMLGSGEAAGAFLEDLRKFAAETPFEFPELQTAASSLVSAGVEASKVVPIMTTLGNVTSGMGTGAEGVQRATVALQQMQAAGKITGEDLAQLRDAGIPVYDLLAAATGKSKEAVVELANAGKLGKQELDQLMGALESGAGLERFSGLMEKQSESLSGQIATLKDTLSQGLGEAAAPLVDKLKEQLPQVTEALTAVMGDLGPVFGALGDMVLSLVPLLQPLASLVGTLAQLFAGLFAQAVEALVPIIATLVPVLETMAHALRDGLSEVLPEIGAAFLAVAQAVAPLLPQLLELAMAVLLPLVRIAAELVTAVAPIVGAFIQGLIPAVEAVLEAIRPLLPVLQEALMSAVVALQPVLGQLATVFVELVQALLPMLPGLVELLAAVVTLIPPLLQLALQVLVPLLDILIPVVGWVAKLVGLFASTLAGDVREVADTMNGAFSGAIDAVSGKLADMIVWFMDLPGRLRGVFSDAGSWLLQAGKDIVAGLLAGLVSMAMAPVEKLKGVGRDMLDGFRGVFGIASPARESVDDASNIVAGLVKGLDPRPVQDAWDSVVASITTPTLGGMSLTAAGAGGGIGAGGVHIGTLVVQGGDRDETRAAVMEALENVASGGRRTLRQVQGRR